MIVRDEATILEECLENIRGLGDELCIVDTGSTDNTLEIAKKFGAKTSVFIWSDDFSAARNESLRLCTGDWVFMFDADERIDPQEIRAFRALADGPRDVCYRCRIRNFTNTSTVSDFVASPPGDAVARGFAGWYPSERVRMWPNLREARFTGQVHEVVRPSLEAHNIRVVESPLPIYHYPLLRAQEQLRQKQMMYLKIGHDKLKSNPTDPQGYIELGNQYAEVGDYANAAGMYREALRRDSTNPETLRDLGAVLHMLRRDEEAQQALRLALEINPNLAGAWRNLGVIHADAKAFEAARECFEKALKYDPAWKEGYRYLSVAMEGAGNFGDAAEASRRALEASPTSPDALRLYIHQILRLERRGEARNFLHELLKKGAETPALYNALAELYYYDGLLEDAKRYFAKAGAMGLASAYNNLGVALFRQQKFAEAKEAFEKCIAGDPGNRGAVSNLEKVERRLEGK